MRIWVDVFVSNVRVAQIEAMNSANASSKLDEAGTFDLQCVLQEGVIDYLTAGHEIALWGQEDAEKPVQWTRGKIMKSRVQETGDNLTISLSGRDQMQELRDTVVGLGRSYNAQTVQTIMDDLLGLISGWTASVEAASAALVQTARFDGSKVLKAILQSTKQLGLHIRMGDDSRVLEIGAFGTAAALSTGQPIWAMQAASSIPPELYANDAVLLIDTISVTEDSDAQVNWAIPMGAGEGSAATTLKDTSYRILNTDNTIYRAGTVPEYPIYRRVNDAGIAEYYIDAADGGDQYQETLSFKTIGPIANSALAKQYASDALANACIESLRRMRAPLMSLELAVRHQRVALKPGEMIHVRHKGSVPTAGLPTSTRSNLTYIDVDDDYWVMQVDRSASENGFVTKLKVSTIDRKVMDETDMIVEVLDRSEVKNVSIQTFPFGFQDSSERIIQGSTLPSDAQYKTAIFSLVVPDIFTDVVAVKLRMITRPLYSVTDVGPDNFAGSGLQALDYFYAVYPSPNYPSDITLSINGVDVTAALGGPWNASAGNSAVDVTLDISTYIIEAAGGLYQNHSLVFAAGYKDAEAKVSTAHNSSVTNASNGVIEAKVLFLGNVRGLF